jgi:geranylgeranyl pyrophosphate synthase
MSRAELLQSGLQWNSAAGEDAYREVIEGKTAALFTACTGSTAIIAKAPARLKDAFLAFGRGFGMAFQVLDDMLDYMPGSPSWGKEPMKDLKEGLVTLPLILALKNSNGLQVRAEIVGYLESKGATSLDQGSTIDFVKRSGALDKCGRLASDYIRAGIDAIGDLVPSGSLRDFASESLKRKF